VTPSRQLAGFLAKYSPEVQRLGKAVLAKMRTRLPGGVEFVYDNYNALVIGFGPNEHPSDAILSIGLYPRYVNLYFLFGAELADPDRRLKGSGTRVRFIRIDDAALLDEPSIGSLIKQALETAPEPMVRKTPRRLVIRAVSKRQRARTPRTKRTVRT
jgi:hypothetical protein